MAAIIRLAKGSPLLFGVGFSGFKTSLSDLIVQKYVEEREEIDWRRNAAFAMFGFGYLGVVQYSLYVPIFSRMFPQAVPFAMKPLAQKVTDLKGQLSVVGQVFVDQCLHHPFMYFPAFYLTKELLSTEPDWDRALRRWRENFWPDLQALWQVWVPVTLLNFSFSPLWMRIPVVATTSLMWTMILSSMRGAEASTSEKKQELARRATKGVDGKLDVLLEPGEDENVIIGPGVTGRTMEIFARGLARRFEASEAFPTDPAETENERVHLCVVAHGEDRVGLVTLLSHWIFESGGNITGSKMLRMHDDFSIILHVTAENSAAARQLRLELLRPDHRPEALTALSIQARELGRATYKTPNHREARLRLTGADTPGIVLAVTRLLSENNVNIDELATDTVNATDTNGNPQPWFLLECFASFPTAVSLSNFDRDLEKLKGDLGVKIDFDWVDEDEA